MVKRTFINLPPADIERRRAAFKSETLPTGITLKYLYLCKVKYVVKHKSAKLFITYAVGKLEAALTISHLI